MARVVVSDTGPLIALALIDLLPLLSRLFTEVYAPDAVVEEAIRDRGKPGAEAIADALANGILKQRTVALDKEFKELSQLLDRGEAEALALAQELDAIALIDERRGRKVAATRGISVAGTAALLARAKATGHLKAVKPYLEELTLLGYRLSPRLIAAILDRCGE